MHIAVKSAFTFTAALLLAGGISLGSAFAAGGDSDGGSEASTPKQKCKTGQVWDPNAATLFGKGKCVAAADVKKPEKQKQGMIYDYGKWLAKNGDFAEAIATLQLAPDQSDPRVLNYLGYSHRKLGKLDQALGYYHAAVAQDPDFSLVREYLGEAYIQLGELEAAREQLTQIERICGGRSCGEYGQLADLIVDSQLKN